MFHLSGALLVVPVPTSAAFISLTHICQSITHVMLADVTDARAESRCAPVASSAARIPTVLVEPSNCMVDPRAPSSEVRPPVRFVGAHAHVTRRCRCTSSGGDGRNVPPGPPAFWDVRSSRLHQDLCNLSCTTDLAERRRSYHQNALGIRALRRLRVTF